MTKLKDKACENCSYYSRINARYGTCYGNQITLTNVLTGETKHQTFTVERYKVCNNYLSREQVEKDYVKHI